MPRVLARLDSSLPGASWSFRPRGAPAAVLRAGDPARILDELARRTRHRWIGYVSYDFGRRFECLPASAADDLDLPALAFMRFDDDDVAHEPENQFPPRASPLRASPRSTFTRDAYLRAVARVLDYIRDGDVYQINLSQRFTLPLPCESIDIYHRLQRDAPAAYGAYLDFGGFQVISNSPELFLRIEPLPGGRRRIVTRPVKGTRPRRPGMDLELRDSAKDQAELAMIVDLERNDLGRVCETGSVKVVEPRVIEAHPTVYHGVATIEGILRDDVTLVDVLRATFPSGSVTGAPKIRAMQIIDELEPVRRGPYCGAVGYIDPSGLVEFNVAIRTMIVKDGQVHVPVGGGIVADSDPAAEFEETLVKAKAMLAALGVERVN
jgi:para-aminobenzoate synthetase component 1